MKTTLRIASCFLLAACSHAAAAPPPIATPAPVTVAAPAPPPIDSALRPLAKLVGIWDGEDLARHSTGTITFAPALDGKALMGRSTNDSPEGHHEDLMVFFQGPGGLRAGYWDNEGHVINYAVDVSKGHIELLSDEMPRAPRFRLTYEAHGDDELAVEFAIGPPDATAFKHYTGGLVHRRMPSH